MESVILGLLLLRPMTGYEIGRFIKTHLSMICSSSAGSVQTALKKLVASGAIEFTEAIENGKNKRTFIITPQGREQFQSWLLNPMQADKVKNMELSKLFFLGLADKEVRKSTIEDYIEQLKAVKQTLICLKLEFEKNIKNILFKFNLDEPETVATYQQYLIEYGIELAEFEINWYAKMLKKIEKEN